MHGTTARGNGSASFYLCDFDGTVARADVGNRFFATFIAARAEWDALIDAWIAETMGGVAKLVPRQGERRVPLERLLECVQRLAMTS